MDTQVFAGHGINWIWYLRIQRKDGKAKIIYHHRIHRYDDNDHPCYVGSFKIIEGEGRIARYVDLTIDDETERLEVINPKNVFDYN